VPSPRCGIRAPLTSGRVGAGVLTGRSGGSTVLPFATLPEKPGDGRRAVDLR
jgi:hypothetical protein